MKRNYVFLATGFEEIEAIATIDVLRRAGLEVTVVSILKDRLVTGANGVTVAADVVFEGAEFGDADFLIFPGGMPGATNLHDFAPINHLIADHVARGGRIASICASPAVVLAPTGILRGKEATCYPSFEGALSQGGAHPREARVVVDGNIITANGPSSAIPFGLAIVKATAGESVAKDIATGMLC